MSQGNTTGVSGVAGGVSGIDTLLPISASDLANSGVIIIPGNNENKTLVNTNPMCGLGDMIFYPIYIPETRTYNDLLFEVTASSLAGNVCEFIIYNMGSDNLPDTKLVETGSVGYTTTGIKTVAIDKEITQGMYWLALLIDNGNSSSDDGSFRGINLIDGSIKRQLTKTNNLNSNYSTLYLSGTYTVTNAPTTPTGFTYDTTAIPWVILAVD